MNKLKKLCQKFENSTYDQQMQSMSLLSKFLEEAGELSQACRKYYGRSLRKEAKGTLDHIEEELGDCLLILHRIAGEYNLSPKKALNKSIVKLTNRVNKYINKGKRH